MTTKANPVTRRLKEGTMLLAVAASAYMLMVLLSYQPSDPAWSHWVNTRHVRNAGGRLGAYLADLFLYIFGFISYALPAMFCYLIWLVCYGKRYEGETDRVHLLLIRTAGLLFVLIAGGGLFSLYGHASAEWVPFTAGGILGNVIGFGLLHLINAPGATLFLLSLLTVGLTLFTGLSWLTIADFLGELVLKLNIKTTLLAMLHAPITLKRQTRKEPKLNVKPSQSEQTVRHQPKVGAKSIEPSIVKTGVGSVSPQSSKPIIGRRHKDNPRPRLKSDGSFPSVELLDKNDLSDQPIHDARLLEEMSKQVELRMNDFGIEVKVVAVQPGPVVTRFELQLAAGTKVSKVTNLAKDIARSMSVMSVRIVEVIPGKPVIGLEIPNAQREIVRLRDVIASSQYEHARQPLTLALGKDISGGTVVVDLGKMPHLLVAGTTGSGKSVGLNAMLLSLLYRVSPEQMRLILIDPKMLELSVYSGIPHLLAPVVTDMKEAASALRWCVAEMERRYRLMAALGVRSIAGYNDKVKEAQAKGTPLLDPLWDATQDPNVAHLTELPFVVVLIDEFADMIMVVGKKVEELIARIAQKARAAGIHLILATQRPSVDVITGLIKANIPTRIAFQVSSKIDSRTILDQAGAEQLLGHGDMLYMPPGAGVPVRVHGAYVADEEVHRVVDDWKQRATPDYLEAILEQPDTDAKSDKAEGQEGGEQDSLYDQAVAIVLETRRASISLIQRRLKIGYNRAARIVESMEEAGLVSPMGNAGMREVLVPE